MTRAKMDGFIVEFARRKAAVGVVTYQGADQSIDADRLAAAIGWMTHPTTRDAAAIIAIARGARALGMSNDAIDRANAVRLSAKRGESHTACPVAARVLIEAHAIATRSAVRAMASGQANANGVTT